MIDEDDDDLQQPTVSPAVATTMVITMVATDRADDECQLVRKAG